MRKMALVILGATCCHAALADVTYRVDLGAGYSDNIRRVDIDPTEETIGMAGLELSWLEDSRRVDADVTIGGDYLHYVDDTFEDEFVGMANGSVTIGLVPEHFTWLLQDSFGQTQSDPFAPATPETRENINYFTTGPDFILNVGASNSVRVFGRYSLTDYEVSPYDGDRTGGGLILTRRLAGQSSIALQGVVERVRFDDTPVSDFDRRDLFLSYSAQGARTQLLVDTGYSSVTLQDETELSGPLARLDVTRNLSPSNSVTLSLGTQFSDGSQALRDTLDGGGSSGLPSGVASAPAPFENQFATMAWNFSRNRTGFSLRASWNKDDYDDQVLDPALGPSIAQEDRTRMVYEVNFSRRLSATLSASLFASLIDEESQSQESSEELRVGGAIDWQFGRHFGLSLTAEQNDRSTSDGLGEYREARGFLTLFYRSGDAANR